MRRLAVRSFDEMLKAPEGEWFSLPEGFDLEVIDDSGASRTRRLHVRLPRRVARDFAPGRGEQLKAQISEGTLIVEKSRKPRQRAH
jgi:hypothetical protein